MLSPKQIHKRAMGQYEAFLRSLCTGSEFFPLRVFGSGMSGVEDYAHTLAALSELRANSRELIGFGYEIEWTQRRFRRYGDQQIPATVSFSTREQYTRSLGKCSEVAQFESDYALIVRLIPELTDWCRAKPIKVVEHASDWEGLLAVCDYLRTHGRPNCYFRELPVPVDTKFIERNRGILSELLPIVAPNCECRDESDFEPRFGFKQKQPMVRFRLLDESVVRSQLPFSDFAVPVDEANTFKPSAAVVLVIENELTFLTLPSLRNAVAILGSGDAVAQLARLEWLRDLPLIYWGDLDSHGFEALSILRKSSPHTESIMMDIDTLNRFRPFWVRGKPFRSRVQLQLTEAERTVFDYLAKEEILLEQERIPQPYAAERLHSRVARVTSHQSGPFPDLSDPSLE